MARVFNQELLKKAIDDLTKGQVTLDIENWLENPHNIILINAKEDVAIFEDMGNGLVNGHYYFKSRGKQAIEAGQNFLDEIFNECYNIQVIRGFVKITTLGARWISRRLGFTSHGVVKVGNNSYELFILTKKEFLNE